MTVLLTQPATSKNNDGIEARITNIRWKAEDSTRCIVQAVPTKGGKPFTVVGDIDNPTIGQVYEFEGKFEFNERYRTEQMKLFSYRTILPDSTHGIQNYLVHTGKWVGPAVAKEITTRFGKDSLKIIKADPDRVAREISGITLARAKEMQTSLRENEKNEAALIELHQMIGGALPRSVASKAVKKWGSKAAIVVRRNPFRLTELPGVAFIAADAIWRSMKKPLDRPRRHCAAIVHVMHEMHQQSGDTILDERTIMSKVRGLVGTVDRRMFEILGAAGVAEERTPGVWSLAYIAKAENDVANRFIVANPPAENPPIEVNTEGLAADQIEAARMFERSPVMILTGGPGTGKTFTTARLIQAVEKRGKLEIGAPTGKAAKQITRALEQTCGGTARTIHSLLGPDYDEESKEFRFEHGPNNKLDVATIVIDEASMLDILLAEQLHAALPHKTRILYVGDRHQLPSVGPGSFLRDMIEAGVPSFELTEIKRNTGRIVAACHEIKDGKSPTPSPALDLDNGENWRHLEVSNPADVVAIIESLYREKIPALGVDMKWGVQTISPMNSRGSLSCEPLNALIQSILNPGRDVEKGLDFSVGDTVVRLKNGRVKGELDEDDVADEDDTHADTEAGEVMIVNGDIGTVEAIEKSKIIVEFVNPKRRVELPRRSHELRLAYCMTCHKMQGSESPVVVLPVHSQFTSAPIWNREWIYTAMSRAKVALITVGELSAIGKAVRRVGNNKRRTMLAELLKIKPITL